MTALQLQLLIAVARTVREMASNPLAPVSTARLSEAPAAVEERYGEPHMAPQVLGPAEDVLRLAEEAASAPSFGKSTRAIGVRDG